MSIPAWRFSPGPEGLRAAVPTFVEVPALILLIAGAMLLTAGCAKRSDFPRWQAPVAIDLEPRCGDMIEGFRSREADFQFAPAATIESSERSLPEGARWFFDPTPNSGLASLNWGFRTTTATDDSKMNSDLRLAAALLEAGETTATPERFRENVSRLGASLATHIEGRWLWIELRFPEPRRDAATRLFSTLFDLRPANAHALEKARRQVALAKLAEESSPRSLAEELFRRLYPPPDGAGQKPGSFQGLEERTFEEIHSFLESTLRFDDSVVIYSGSGQPDAVHDLVAATIARASRPRDQAVASKGSTRSRPTSAVDEGRARQAIHIVDRPDAGQVEFLIGYPTVAPRHPDFIALKALASLLGGNVGGRLFRDLRERQGLAYIINAEQSDEGRFVVVTRARHERAVALLQGIEAHLRALTDRPLETCEVEMLKRRLVGEEALLSDDYPARSQRYRSDMALLGRLRSTSSVAGEIDQDLSGKLEGLGRRYFLGPPTIVLVGDAVWLRHDLSRAFPKHKIRVFNAGFEAID